MAYKNSSFIFVALGTCSILLWIRIKIIVLIYDGSDITKNRFEGVRKKKRQSHLTICRNKKKKKVVKNSLMVSFFHLQMTSWEHCVNVSPIMPIFMAVVSWICLSYQAFCPAFVSLQYSVKHFLASNVVQWPFVQTNLLKTVSNT